MPPNLWKGSLSLSKRKNRVLTPLLQVWQIPPLRKAAKPTVILAFRRILLPANRLGVGDIRLCTFNGVQVQPLTPDGSQKG